jgi:hypothetical protein
MDREGWTDGLVDLVEWIQWIRWNGQWISGSFTGMEWITDILMGWNGVEWNGSIRKAGSSEVQD